MFRKAIIDDFANDTNMLHASKNLTNIAHKNLTNIESVMNNELKRMLDWIGAINICMNEFKTKLILFRPLRRKCWWSLDIKLKNYLFKLVNKVTHVGVETGKVLSSNKQIGELKKEWAKQMEFVKTSISLAIENTIFNLLLFIPVVYHIQIYDIPFYTPITHPLLPLERSRKTLLYWENVHQAYGIFR